jgi:hypothetical protein
MFCYPIRRKSSAGACRLKVGMTSLKLALRGGCAIQNNLAAVADAAEADGGGAVFGRVDEQPKEIMLYFGLPPLTSGPTPYDIWIIHIWN